MRYSIENDTLRLTVDTHGAEAVSVIHKPTGAELLWEPIAHFSCIINLY